MKKLIILLIVFSSTLFSCGVGEQSADYAPPSYESDYSGEESKAEPMEEGEASSEQIDYSQIISSSATLPFKLDSGKLFIITGDIQFRTEDVFKATLDVERFVQQAEGYVESTHLLSRQLGHSTYRLSENSVLDVTNFRMENQFVLRIPNDNLDNCLKQLVPLIEYLDFRNIEVKDVAIELKEEELRRKRNEDYKRRMASHIKQSPSDLEDVTAAEDRILEAQRIKDESYIEKLRIEDQIKYSTIRLNIYGRNNSKEIKLVAPKEYAPYEKPYSQQAGEGAQQGFNFVKLLSIGIITLWPLWIILGIVWLIIRRQRSRNKDSQK